MKNSFGKGLESLIPPKKDTRFKAYGAKKEAVFSIDVGQVKPNPYQPRKEFNNEGLKSLSDSILQHGVLQPLIVNRVEGAVGEYQLIAGERRLLASRMAGLTQVPAIVREPTDKEKLELSLIENVQRVDLNPIEKAEAFQKLQKEFNFSQKDITDLVGGSREAVINTLRLLKLPEEIKQAVREEKISGGHARAILGAKDKKKQKLLFDKTVKEGISVRETEYLVQKLNAWKSGKKANPLDKKIQTLEEKVKKVLKIDNLKLVMASGKPKLTIVFDTKKEIEDLLKRFK